LASVPGQFSSNAAPLELAYALTVHKAQGSEFDTVFVVLPEKTRFLSRELVYTALTSSKKKLWCLLIQGKDASVTFRAGTTDELRDRKAQHKSLLQSGSAVAMTFRMPSTSFISTRKNIMVQSKSELTLATYFASSDVGSR
jgi:hypothetical protein